MRDRGTRMGVICFVVLLLVSQEGWGQSRFETQVKTITVVDANGVPVPDARVYQGASLVWDSQAQAVRLTEDAPWQRTAADGAFSFEFVRQGAGRPYFVTDAALERMGCLFIARKDPNETYTVQLEEPAHIKGVIRSGDVPLSDVHVKLYYYVPEKALYPLLSADYNLQSPGPEVTLDLLCPAGCDLILHIEPEGLALRKYQKDREIAPLKPGQVLDIGSIELHATSGFRAFGKPATELHVSEWVKGEPVTLAELKGKVVLLDFWGLWCGPCRKAMPKLVELHEKYARDGLEIIALHDASQSKASLLGENRQYLDLSDIPFRVAIDAAPHEGPEAQLVGQGKTIEAYGVTGFPTLLLIDKDGQVQTGQANEERLYLLLYGRPIPKPTFVGRMIAAHRGLFVKLGVATGLILLLGLVLGALRLRQSRIEVRGS